jgi:hypothetical protein
MKRIVSILMCLATVLSFAGCFGNSYDTDFTISRMTYFADNKEKSLVAKLAIQIDDSEKKFNYFGIKYTSDSYLKCSLTYSVKKETVREEFFLEPSQSEKDFYSFIDNALEKVIATNLIEFTCEPLNSSKAKVKFIGFSVFSNALV